AASESTTTSYVDTFTRYQPKPKFATSSAAAASAPATIAGTTATCRAGTPLYSTVTPAAANMKGNVRAIADPSVLRNVTAASECMTSHVVIEMLAPISTGTAVRPSA